MTRMPPQPSGFTLMEVMVALVITSLLASLLFDSLHVLAHSQERLAERDSRQRALVMTTAWHADSAQGLQLDPTLNFSGASDHWSGFSLQPLTTAHPRLVQVEWTIRSRPERSVLAYREGDNTNVIELPLADEPARFGFLDSEGELHSQWPPALGQQAPLPAAIVLLLGGGEGRVHSVIRLRQTPPEPWRQLPAEDE